MNKNILTTKKFRTLITLILSLLLTTSSFLFHSDNSLSNKSFSLTADELADIENDKKDAEENAKKREQADAEANAKAHDVKVYGKSNYDFAFQVLDLVNKERAKELLNPVTMNATLLEHAMLRAAECQVKYSHTRPNGLSAFYVSNSFYSENIAIGSSLPKDVMNLWMDSPGHRANILNPSWKTLGVGSFKAKIVPRNFRGRIGIDYTWVQIFSAVSEPAVSKPKNIYREYIIKSTVSYPKYDTYSPVRKAATLQNTKAKKNKVTVKCLKEEAIKDIKYQISYKLKNKKAWKSKTIKDPKTKITIKKLKSKKKYQIKVRAYTTDIKGKKHYNNWSKIRTVKIK